MSTGAASATTTASAELLVQLGFVGEDEWGPRTFPGVSELLAVLRNDPRVTRLSLWNCSIPDANVEVLAGHLKNNTHLRTLNFGHTHLTDAGVKPIAQALANHPTLKGLDLWHNKGITDASCPALAELLHTVPTLEYLGLDSTSITDGGVKTLCAAVATHPTIKKLWLSTNKAITDASCTALANLLSTVPTLEHLDVLYTSITAKGQAALAAALGRKRPASLVISLTPEEKRLRMARYYLRWNEDQHCRTAVDFRRNLAEALGCLEEHGKAIFLPWHDVRRVIQGWCIVRLRQP